VLAGVLVTTALVAAFAAGVTQWVARDGVLVLHVTVKLALATAWLALGLIATEHDRHVGWARRLAPMLVSIGVVELLRALEHVRPDQHRWGLAATALLASLAMLAMHAAFVDLIESSRAGLRGADRPLAPASATLPPTRETVHEVPVAEVVAEVAAQHRSLGQEVRLRGGAGTVAARARTGDLVAALDAVLANAAEHACGSPVTVHVVAIADRVEVAVTDRGPGLTAAAADRLFADDMTTRGLAVARQLLRRNGGELVLRNRIGGATFVLSLPAVGAEQVSRPAERRELVQRRGERIGTATV
jgi:signal transduction histidine kinase